MVELVEYRDTWPHDYAAEAERLLPALGVGVVELEHIGSTAVPGMTAKPIIDIAARASAHTDPFELADRVAPLHYVQHRAGPKSHGV